MGEKSSFSSYAAKLEHMIYCYEKSKPTQQSLQLDDRNFSKFFGWDLTSKTASRATTTCTENGNLHSSQCVKKSLFSLDESDIYEEKDGKYSLSNLNNNEKITDYEKQVAD